MPESTAIQPSHAQGIAHRLVQRAHRTFVHSRRVRVLAEELSRAMMVSGDWLDVGCGDGRIDQLIMQKRDDLRISGVDVSARSSAMIPVRSFDGLTIPCESASYDGVMIVDVLHHTTHAKELLSEIVRVARRQIVIKDVVADSWLEGKLLAFMDVVGNRPYDVPCPFTFLSTVQWSELFGSLGFQSPAYQRGFRLYPFPFTYVFDGRLHFVAVLNKPVDAVESP